MKGRAKFISASGKERDESMVRMDYNKAKIIGKVRYGRYFIFYPGVAQWLYIDYQDIVWAYRRLEDVQNKFSQGEGNFEVHSIMLVTKERNRVGVPVGEKENAVKGLDIIEQKNSFIDIGYSREKEEKYL